MKKRQRKKLEKQIGNPVSPWEIIEYEPIYALVGGQAMKAESVERPMLTGGMQLDVYYSGAGMSLIH